MISSYDVHESVSWAAVPQVAPVVWQQLLLSSLDEEYKFGVKSVGVKSVTGG